MRSTRLDSSLHKILRKAMRKLTSGLLCLKSNSSTLQHSSLYSAKSYGAEGLSAISDHITTSFPLSPPNDIDYNTVTSRPVSRSSSPSHFTRASGQSWALSPWKVRGVRSRKVRHLMLPVSVQSMYERLAASLKIFWSLGVRSGLTLVLIRWRAGLARKSNAFWSAICAFKSSVLLRSRFSATEVSYRSGGMGSLNVSERHRSASFWLAGTISENRTVCESHPLALEQIN
jgi:hypothetical protein